MEFQEGSGVHVDFASKTVLLYGRDMIDHIFGMLTDLELGVEPEVITGAAKAVASLQFPDYVDVEDGRFWTFGADENDIDYLMSKLVSISSEYEAVPFKTGETNGAV